MDFFLGTQKRVRNSRGKRAISVRVTEVLLYIKFVKLYPRVLNTKFQGIRTSGSREDFLSFYHLWAWQPSWSCDLNQM